MLLVTGAAGFLGRRVVAAARAEALPVRAVLRRADAAPVEWRGDPGVDIAVADLAECDPGPLIAGVAAVVHAAAALAGDDARQARDTVGPTRRLLDALRPLGPGGPLFVLVSSLSVYNYASLPDGATLDETSALEPDPAMRDAYCRAKLAQEALTMAAVQEAGLRARIIRPGAIHGPGRLWTAAIGLRVGSVALCVGGDAALPLVDVDACAVALLRAAEAPAVRSDLPDVGAGGWCEIVNVVDPTQPTQRAYLRGVAAAMGLRATLVLPRKPLRLAARAAGIMGLVAPRLVARLPGVLRAEAQEARFRPLRYSVARRNAYLDLPSATH